MRSAAEPRPARAALLAAGLLCMAAQAAPQAPTPPAAAPAAPAAASAPRRADVEAVMRALRADPDLRGSRVQKTLKFKPWDEAKEDKPKPKPKVDPSLWRWMRDFSRWLTDAGRVFVWILAGVAVALVAVSLRYWLRIRAEAAVPGRAGLPSHVRDLDIRPESLPDDVGAAARQLWLAGQARAALSLLYRGALSRLVHDHALPIRAASTEGDCLALARRSLDAGAAGYFARLVGAWQLAVYGARQPAQDEVLALCDDFERCLARATDTAPAGPPAAGGSEAAA